MSALNPDLAGAGRVRRAAPDLASAWLARHTEMCKPRANTLSLRADLRNQVAGPHTPRCLVLAATGSP